MVRLYSSLPLPLRASHVNILINCAPVVLGGCAGLKRSAFILTTLALRPVTLGGSGGPGRISATVRAAILCGFPHPAPCLLGVHLL